MDVSGFGMFALKYSLRVATFIINLMAEQNHLWLKGKLSLATVGNQENILVLAQQ